MPIQAHLVLKYWVPLWLLFLGLPPRVGAEILVFSPSHLEQFSTTQAEGVLDIQISSIEPIDSVKLNGVPVTITKGYDALLQHRYHLKKGINRFEVEIASGKDSQKAVYQIELLGLEEGEKKEKAFSMLSLLGLHQVSNMENVPANQSPKAGTKLQFLVRPQYRLSLERKLYATLLREKITPTSLSSREIVLSQIGAQDRVMGLNLDGGINHIGTGTQGLLAKEKVETDLFVKATLPLAVFKVSAALTYRDLAYVPSNAQENEDGLRWVFAGDYARKFGDLDSTWLAGYETMDAKGTYQDRSVLRVGASLSKDIGGLHLSGVLDLKQTQYKSLNLSTNIKESSKLTSFEASAGYPLKWVNNLLCLGQLKYSTQSSNLSARVYHVTDIGVSLIHHF